MKANQKFAQADEAVSPVIGVILMVAITVVLAAVVFVLVSDLSDTGEKSEDVAIKAESPKDGEIWITMIRGGAEAPYEMDNQNAATADDALVTIDGIRCLYDTPGVGTENDEFTLTNEATDDDWGPSEVIRITRECENDDDDADGILPGDAADDNDPLLTSGQEYVVQVTVRGSLVFTGTVVVQ